MARALMIAAVERATKRASAQVRLEFSDGLSGLATVTSLAPWLGLLATLEAFVNAFVGCGGEKSACMAATVAGISRAIWPTALGVGIGVIALCGYRCLSATVERFDAEMQAASRDLVNTLVAYRGCWSFATVGDCAIPGGILDTNAPRRPRPHLHHRDSRGAPIGRNDPDGLGVHLGDVPSYRFGRGRRG
jgi:hypothetical protein